MADKLDGRDPKNPGVVLGAELLADGTSKIRTGMDGVPGDPARPGLIVAAGRMTTGSSQLADGTTALNSGINGNPADPANPGLLGGSLALASGATGLSAGNTKLAAGSSEPSAGAAKLADGNAKIAEGTDTLYSSAAAVSPQSMVGESDAALALGIVGVLGLGAAGAYVLLRSRRTRAESAPAGG